LSSLSSSIQATESYHSSEIWQTTETTGNLRSLLIRAEFHAQELKWWSALSKGVFDNNLRPAPKNKATIRWDDKNDIYTNKRDTVNGTEYVFWCSIVKIDISESESDAFYHQTLYKPGFKYEPTGAILLNPSHIDGNIYHNYVQSSDEYQTKYVPPRTYSFTDDMYVTYAPRVGDQISALDQGVIDYIRFDDFISYFAKSPLSNPRSGGIVGRQFLNFASQLETISRPGGGMAVFELNESTGTGLPGILFNALADNPKANLSFEQNGATVTFAGKDMVQDVSGFYDFEYSASSYLAKQMLETALMTGGESFIYSFKHHGDLPGVATFNITTNITEGARVNVYRYNADTGTFTIIEKNLKVSPDGSVTYRNNSMSHYLITTNTIEGAVTQGETVNWWLYIIIAAAVVLAAAGAVVFIVLQKKKRTISPQSV